MSLAKQVVDTMINSDAFSKWLGIELLEISEGYCKLQMTVRKEMTNGFNIAHGGITYSLADSTLAFAANSYGLQVLSIETSISHINKINIGDIIISEAKEVNRGNKTGLYYVTIKNQNNVEVAHFKGTVYITNSKWDVDKQ